MECDPDWKNGSAEAEEEQTMECGKSVVWRYQKAGITEPADPDRT